MNNGEYASYFSRSNIPSVSMFRGLYGMPVLSNARYDEMGRKLEKNPLVSEDKVGAWGLSRK
jgi:hypothetical protein